MAGRRRATTRDLALTELSPAIDIVELAAGERLAAPMHEQRWRPWYWAAAVVLHVVVVAFFLLFAWRHTPENEEQSAPGVSVVFDNGGAQQTAPPAPIHGPPSVAQTPPPPPPPPQQNNLAQAEVNLNMPDMPLATVRSAPQSQPRPQPLPTPRPAPPHKYVVMNNMSYGNGSPAPPMPQAQKALNLSLPETDAQAVTGQDFSVKGDVGADWDASLTKWVNANAYYPQAAAEQGQQGTAEVKFTVDRKGNVTGLHLLRSAGSPFLDGAWMNLFAQNQLPPFPAGTKADHVEVDYTVHYQIIQ